MSNTMTPYAAAKIANKVLEENGIEKTLPPQMLYTYTAKGYIKSETVNGKRRVTREQLDEWLVKYVSKLLGNTIEESDENVDENQLDLFEDTDEA